MKKVLKHRHLKSFFIVKHASLLQENEDIKYFFRYCNLWSNCISIWPNILLTFEGQVKLDHNENCLA